ncbi:MAG TPA: SRPBCC family protein [Steroidobacteraceae bacterium]
MRLVKGLLFGLAVLTSLLLAAGLILPKSAHVERSIRTSASPAAVYALVDGFQHFNEWSPWSGLDPKTKYSYSGPPSGVGAKMTWNSDDPNVGSGSQEIIAVEPDRMVRIRLEFGDQGPSQSTLTIMPDGTGSTVTWAFAADFTDRYFDRYLGLMFDRFIGPDYEKGLAKLKKVAEATP